MIWWVLSVSMLATVASGALLGPSIGFTGLVLLLVSGGTTALAAPAVWNVFTDFTLSAVPVFLAMGEILIKSGVSDRLYNALAPLFHRLPGRLLHSNIWGCAVFGAVNGSSSATAAAIGSVAYPELAKRGYYGPWVVGSLAGAGTLGLIIPPSLSLLLYGALTGTSVGRLFLAGVIPGVMIAAMFSFYVMIIGTMHPERTPAATRPPTFREIVQALLGIWPVAFLVFTVLGTIYLGLATATESAGLGVAMAIILGFAWGELSPRRVWEAFFAAARVYGILCFVILGTLVLAQAVANIGLPRQILTGVFEIGASKYLILLIIVGIYFVLGCFFDGVSMMIITIPVVFPLMTELGFDAVWLGVIITLLIEIGAITPPVGVNLFVLSAITRKGVSLPEAASAAIPYWMMLLAAIAILAVWPEIALVLPRVLN